METLRKQLDELLAKLPDSDAVRARINQIYSVYPFNEFEYLISTLLARNGLTLEQYYEIRDSYIERNAFLYIFEIGGPRTFGEAWAHAHLKELVPELSKPSKNSDTTSFLLPSWFMFHSPAAEAVASRHRT